MTLSTRRFLAGLAGAALAAPGVAPAQPAPRPYRTEIVVRTARNLRTPAEVASLVEHAAATSVAVINVAAKQDEDDEVPSGTVFFHSHLAPRAPGWERFDALAETVRVAHRHGIKVRAWVPQFHDQAAARRHPAWQMQAAVDGKPVPFEGKKNKEYFVNPLDPEVQDYQRAIVAEIARGYAVDGIVLDWLRFDDFNMDVGPGTRARYRAHAGIDPLAIDFATDNPARRAWNAWRAAALGDYVRGIRGLLDATRPGLELGFYILPPEFVELAQDAATFAGAVDFLSPLAYFRDWGYAPRWVYRNVIPDTVAKAGRARVIPVLDEDWTDAAYREIIPHLRRDFPAIDTLSWFVYGRWNEGVLRRIDLLRRW
ncbi:MAG: family 10 glycosylhydrolase [Proteobacteria bacterium]|nr:family 10 glycosylhydrolase [Pseudomonadota bacterium]